MNIVLLIYCVIVIIATIMIDGKDMIRNFIKYGLMIVTIIAIIYLLKQIGIDVFGYVSKLFEFLSEKIKEGGKLK
jgi:hypothetical protein